MPRHAAQSRLRKTLKKLLCIVHGSSTADVEKALTRGANSFILWTLEATLDTIIADDCVADELQGSLLHHFYHPQPAVNMPSNSRHWSSRAYDAYWCDQKGILKYTCCACAAAVIHHFTKMARLPHLTIPTACSTEGSVLPSSLFATN